MVEPIEMPFGLSTQVGPGNHVLDRWGSDPARKMATLRWRAGPDISDDTPPWAVQKWLNRSRCCLGCGLRWAQGSMCYVGCALAQPGEYDWIVHVWVGRIEAAAMRPYVKLLWPLAMGCLPSTSNWSSLPLLLLQYVAYGYKAEFVRVLVSLLFFLCVGHVAVRLPVVINVSCSRRTTTVGY